MMKSFIISGVLIFLVFFFIGSAQLLRAQSQLNANNAGDDPENNGNDPQYTYDKSTIDETRAKAPKCQGQNGSKCHPLPKKEKLEANEFTIVLLPDTQHYTEEPYSTSTYFKQAEWIVSHKDQYNIKHVIHLGDITEKNADDQWGIATSAHKILDENDILYSVVPGNHDYRRSGGKLYRNESRFNTYFGPNRYKDLQAYTGRYGSYGDDGANNYALFEVGELRFIVIGLEYAPRKDVLCWANRLIQRHPDRRVIIVTHCYLSHGGRLAEDCSKKYHIEGSDGNAIWSELVSLHSNAFLVLSGHINDSECVVQNGKSNNMVMAILTDFQHEEFLTCDIILKKGGNGWLRTLRFVPKANRIDVETHSVEAGGNEVFTDGTPRFFCPNYDNDPAHSDHCYSFEYDMSTKPMEYKYQASDMGCFNDRTVNREAAGQQINPAIAMDKKGSFVVVWQDDKDKNDCFQIYARGFEAGGCGQFSDMCINDEAAGQQKNPAIAMDEKGNFVVVWQDDKDKNGNYQIYARGFTAQGKEKFARITVNTEAKGQQINPAIAMDEMGHFVVIWQDDKDENGKFQIYARGFTAQGKEKFARITVNTEAAGQQINPAIAMDEKGNFVVVWQDDKDKNDKSQIYARGFTAQGKEKFARITVNTEAAGQQINPAIAMDKKGNFVVVWQDDKDKNDYFQIYARGFTAQGKEKFARITVNTEAAGQQINPAIAMDKKGNFVVVWQDDKDKNDKFQIYARGFTAQGKEKFARITVNTDAKGQQINPAIAMDEMGHFVVVWQDDKDENDYFQIYARGLNANKK